MLNEKEELEDCCVRLTGALLESIIAYCDEFGDDPAARKIATFVRRGMKNLEKDND